MFQQTRLILSLIVFAMIFSFSFHPITSDSGINKVFSFGPALSLAQDSDWGDDDDDDDKPDEDDDDTDGDPFILYSFFDLRDRETFVQVTNPTSAPQIVHVQVFNVASDCNENNFYDVYTGNDTHVYNIRDILTNDGNPAGFVLPNNAYGAVIISTVQGIGLPIIVGNIVGNVRLLDAQGFEYRTNLPGKTAPGNNLPQFGPDVLTFNYNNAAGVVLSDVFGITSGNNFPGALEVTMSDPTSTNNLVDIDIYNLDEVPFSCRDVLFACVEEGGSRYQETLEEEGVAVASFDYGINDALPSSKDAPLLCPNNNIANGFVRIQQLDREGFFIGFIGLNNGNGRGSIDSFWRSNQLATPPT